MANTAPSTEDSSPSCPTMTVRCKFETAFAGSFKVDVCYTDEDTSNSVLLSPTDTVTSFIVKEFTSRCKTLFADLAPSELSCDAQSRKAKLLDLYKKGWSEALEKSDDARSALRPYHVHVEEWDAKEPPKATGGVCVVQYFRPEA